MSNTTAWILLALSGLTDVAWAVAVKKADGFRHLGWAGASLVLLLLFVGLLTRALQVLPLGLAYAVWVGIGAVGAMGAGMVLFGEPVQASRLGFATVVVIGVAGLKLSSG